MNIFPWRRKDGSKPKQDIGNKRMAYLSRVIIAQIPVRGVAAVRRQVIKGIEDDLKRAAKKGPEKVDAMLKDALRTPDYMEMIRQLSMDESHL